MVGRKSRNNEIDRHKQKALRCVDAVRKQVVGGVVRQYVQRVDRLRIALTHGAERPKESKTSGNINDNYMSLPPKPMLAPTEPLRWDELDPTRTYAIQPKLDGIRCKFHRGMPYTRSGKLIPNQQLANSLRDCYLSSPYNGLDLDGELLLWNPVTRWYKPFNEIQSVVMSSKRMNMVDAQDWIYMVFDHDGPASFEQRYFVDLMRHPGGWQNRIQLVETMTAFNEVDLRFQDMWHNTLGYEGSIIRRLDSPYKHGRVTCREGYLRKVVEWVRDEATVVGTIELRENIDTSCKREENMFPANRLGALVVWHPKFGSFEIGTGFDAEQRERYWRERDTLPGQRLTFKYRPSHIKNKPCPAVFVGWRTEDNE